MINDDDTEKGLLRENPLRVWRKAQALKVSHCVADSAFSPVSWYQWEAWPGDSSRYPSPHAFAFIAARTEGAVTANDFQELMQVAA